MIAIVKADAIEEVTDVLTQGGEERRIVGRSGIRRPAKIAVGWYNGHLTDLHIVRSSLAW